MLHIDENKRVVMKLGLFWAIASFLIASAFFIGYTVNHLSEIQQNHEKRLDNLETIVQQNQIINAEINTKLAVIDTKMTDIQRRTERIENSVGR